MTGVQSKKKNAQAAKRGTAKKRREVQEGCVTIVATFNNTKIVITDLKNNVLNWASSGRAGFKGARKGGPHPAQQAAEQAARLVSEGYNMTRITTIKLKGPGPGRDHAVKGLVAAGLDLKGATIIDATGIPHNGTRPPKERRV